MLKKLYVSDFAIIEDLTVEFDSGMTVLTGETGAGKSLIIDTISLLLGARADADMIRYGRERAYVEGVFDSTPQVEGILDKYNIPTSTDCTIVREIYGNSRNSIKINGTSVNLTILKSIAVVLADIHIQNDTYRLFNPDTYLSFIDNKEDKKLDSYLTRYSKSLYTYLEHLKEYEHILKGQKTAQERLEFLQFEAEELSGLNLREGIDTELEEKIAKLSNYDKIFSALTASYKAIENETSPLDQLYEAAKELGSIEEYDVLYKDYSEKLMDGYYIASEIKNEISHQISSLDYDEEELNQYIEELNQIDKAKEKYKMSVSELIEYLKKIKLDIEITTNYDEVLRESKMACEASYKDVVKCSIELTEYRKKLSKKLESGIVKECIDLDLEHTKFEIVFEENTFDDFTNKSIFTEQGCDRVSFLISFNKGEPLKSLHKVASGGEMSRIMLAFKSYLAKTSVVSLMVFDEIDTGVSGTTAKKIAYKMHEIASHIQVLCITHLPQVAAIGDYHKHIYKVEENGRTTTQIKNLSFKERVEEIAAMLSGDKLSIFALEHAKALLENKD